MKKRTPASTLQMEEWLTSPAVPPSSARGCRSRAEHHDIRAARPMQRAHKANAASAAFVSPFPMTSDIEYLLISPYSVKKSWGASVVAAAMPSRNATARHVHALFFRF